MHLYLALLFHRDYFARLDASLSGSFVPQGLLYPGQMHLYLAFLFHRDYFDRPDASLSDSFAPQGLFRPTECISVWLFCASGIISTDRMHPITGRPSLKTSLPGHSVNLRFICPGTEKGRMKNFRFPHVLFRSSEDHTFLSLASYIFAAICLATYTPLAEAWDSECVMPLPSPIIYRPS